MKLLLTSAGFTNASIRNALIDLIGKPIEEAGALCVPTAAYAHPLAGPDAAWRFVAGQEPRTPMCELGWKSLGVLELTALPTLDEKQWKPAVQETDVLLVSGGETAYLCHWMRESGLIDLFPSLTNTVYVGLSAGSVVMTPRIGMEFVNWQPPSGADTALGIVDFSIFPHLDHEDMPAHSMACAEAWATRMPRPGYAIDDATAIRVVDGAIDVVSEGNWKLFEPS